MAEKVGLYPDWMIADLMKSGAIQFATKANIGPVSVNLRMWGGSVRDITDGFDPGLRAEYEITETDGAAHALSDPFTRQRLYGGELMEFFQLPGTVAGECTGRSTLARADVVVHGVARGASTFDEIPRGYQGGIWAQLAVNSCDLKLRRKDAVLQAFFFERRAPLFRDEVLELQERTAIFWHKTEDRPLRSKELVVTTDGYVALTADLSEEYLGWEVRGENSATLDLRERGMKAFSFYRPPRPPKPPQPGVVVAWPWRLLLLASKERVRIPPDHAGVLGLGDEALLSYRTNEACLVQPGWGWGKSGEGHGRSIVLELRERSTPRLITDGQIIGYVRFERLVASAMHGYDAHDRSQFLGESRYSIFPPQFRKRR